ncbi:hypothetical protein BH10BAC2_BH10BAC2_35140 [soil metagenome]
MPDIILCWHPNEQVEEKTDQLVKSFSRLITFISLFALLTMLFYCFYSAL